MIDNQLSSFVEIKSTSKNFQFDTKHVIVEWYIGGHSQIMMTSLRNYSTSSDAFGFSKLFSHHWIHLHDRNMYVSIEIVDDNIAIHPDFVPSAIGGRPNKHICTRKYINKPTKCMLTPVTEHVEKLKDQNAKKPIYAQQPLQIDRARIRAKIIKKNNGVNNKKTNDKHQLTLTQCNNFGPIMRMPSRWFALTDKSPFNEYIMSKGNAMQLFLQLWDEMDLSKEECYRYMPIIDCFPSSKGKYMQWCKETVTGSYGFWSSKMNNENLWKDKTAWLHFASIETIKFAFEQNLLTKRQMKAICCLSVWRRPDEHWSKVRRYDFLKSLIESSGVYAWKEAICESRAGNKMDYVAFYVDYTQVISD